MCARIAWSWEDRKIGKYLFIYFKKNRNANGMMMMVMQGIMSKDKRDCRVKVINKFIFLFIFLFLSVAAADFLDIFNSDGISIIPSVILINASFPGPPTPNLIFFLLINKYKFQINYVNYSKMTKLHSRSLFIALQ